MARLQTRGRSGSAELLKSTARRLFSERGVDGVTVREIAEASQQKNHAAVAYYFNSKENLVRELVADGARRIDDRRNARLDQIEAGGGPRTVREVVDALVYPSIPDAAADSADEDYYLRFIFMLGLTHRELFINALENRWNSGYLRCLEHLRRLMPPMPAAIKNQRFVFMGGYVGVIMAMRDAAVSDLENPHLAWRSPATLEHLALTLTAMLTAPGPADAE